MTRLVLIRWPYWICDLYLAHWAMAALQLSPNQRAKVCIWKENPCLFQSILNKFQCMSIETMCLCRRAQTVWPTGSETWSGRDCWTGGFDAIVHVVLWQKKASPSNWSLLDELLYLVLFGVKRKYFLILIVHLYLFEYYNNSHRSHWNSLESNGRNIMICSYKAFYADFPAFAI